MIDETRCLSKCVKNFLHFKTTLFDSGSRGISQAGPYADYGELTQWRASLSECRQVFAFVIGDPIFPATEYDANPFESQRTYRRVVVAAPISLLLVVGPSPHRLRNRVTRPFVKALSQKLRTGPAEMHPLPFPAPLRHRRDPTVGLQFGGAAVTISWRAKGSQQPRCHPRARSRQRVKNEIIRMLGGRFFNLPVQLRNALEQTADELHDHFHHHALGFDHRSVSLRRNRVADRQDATLPQSAMAVVLAEELSQFFP